MARLPDPFGAFEESRIAREIGIVAEDIDGGVSRHDHDVEVARAGNAECAASGLVKPEEIPAPAPFKVFFCNNEAVIRFFEHAEPAQRRRERSIIFRIRGKETE